MNSKNHNLSKNPLSHPNKKTNTQKSKKANSFPRKKVKTEPEWVNSRKLKEVTMQNLLISRQIPKYRNRKRKRR